MNLIRIFVISGTLLLGGCINREHVKYSADWPERAEIADINELEGVYKNKGQGAGDLLWYYLTKEERSNPSHSVLIKIDDREIIAVLLDGSRQIKEHSLEEGQTYQLDNGRLTLNTKYGGEVDPLASGVGYEKYELYLTHDQDIVGNRRGASTGLILNILPALGYGRKWSYWQKEEMHNMRLQEDAAKAPRP